MSVLGFRVEWYDPQPKLTREFVLRIYVDEMQIEMYDLNSRRMFLKKSPLPKSIQLSDLHVGNKITLHSRALHIVQYSDQTTERALSRAQVKSTCVLMPKCVASRKLGAAISMMEGAGLKIKKLKMTRLNVAESEECTTLLHESKLTKKDFSFGHCVFATVAGSDAVEVLKRVSKAISALRCESFPEELACAAPTTEAGEGLEELAFGVSRPLSGWPTARYGPDATCCVIRPHIIANSNLGAVLSHIEASHAYEISAMGFFQLDVPTAFEFLEIYDGVVPEFDAVVKQLSFGVCCAVELRGQNAVLKFRKMAGPWDVDFAKETRPNTIRAKFGVSNVKNAIHCTDLADIAESELRYFFDLLKPC
jgi:nucleoside-diphosphate kinase